MGRAARRARRRHSPGQVAQASYPWPARARAKNIATRAAWRPTQDHSEDAPLDLEPVGGRFCVLGHARSRYQRLRHQVTTPTCGRLWDRSSGCQIAPTLQPSTRQRHKDGSVPTQFIAPCFEHDGYQPAGNSCSPASPRRLPLPRVLSVSGLTSALLRQRTSLIPLSVPRLVALPGKPPDQGLVVLGFDLPAKFRKP